MIASYTRPLFVTPRPPVVRGAQSGVGHLFAAAVVNRQFRQLLLENPEVALKNGYLGEVFELSREEQDRVTSASARSLADLAKTMTNIQS
jgi:hypothetical protein